MIYINVNLYRYFIGRGEQSVNEHVMINNLDQQIKVNKMMIDSANLNNVNDGGLQNYLFHHLEIVTAITLFMLKRSKMPEHLYENHALWQYVREKDEFLYFRLKRGLLGKILNMPGGLGHGLSTLVYRISRKLIGFN